MFVVAPMDSGELTKHTVAYFTCCTVQHGRKRAPIAGEEKNRPFLLYFGLPAHTLVSIRIFLNYDILACGLPTPSRGDPLFSFTKPTNARTRNQHHNH